MGTILTKSRRAASAKDSRSGKSSKWKVFRQSLSFRSKPARQSTSEYRVCLPLSPIYVPSNGVAYKNLSAADAATRTRQRDGLQDNDPTYAEVPYDKYPYLQSSPEAESDTVVRQRYPLDVQANVFPECHAKNTKKELSEHERSTYCAPFAETVCKTLHCDDDNRATTNDRQLFEHDYQSRPVSVPTLVKQFNEIAGATAPHALPHMYLSEGFRQDVALPRYIGQTICKEKTANEDNEPLCIDVSRDGGSDSYSSANASLSIRRSENRPIQPFNRMPAIKLDRIQSQDEQPVYSNSDRRDFTHFPVDEGSTYRWNGLVVNPAIKTDGDQNAVSEISIGWSTNQFDFPRLPEGFKLLNDAVIHCLPHRQTFAEPVYVAFQLLPGLSSASEIFRLSIYYSETDVGETPRWTSFRLNACYPSGDLQYVETLNEGDQRRANTARACIESGELILELYHFCLFTVVVDGREEQVQRATIGTFAKFRVSARSFSVDVVMLVGCDDETMASHEAFTIGQGYKKVESIHFHVSNIGGDVTVQTTEDGAEWMTDAKISGPKSYVYPKVDVVSSVTKSTFCIVSSEAVQSTGVDSSFTFSATVAQAGRRPVLVRLLTDLHELAHELPYCQCLPRCVSKHQPVTAHPSAVTAERPTQEDFIVNANHYDDADTKSRELNLNLVSVDVPFLKSISCAPLDDPLIAMKPLSLDSTPPIPPRRELQRRSKDTDGTEKNSESRNTVKAERFQRSDDGLARRAKLAEKF